MAGYDPQTALLIVDVQNDFADPEGGLYVSGGEQVVPLLNDEIALARDSGAAVVYTQDWHPESTPHFAKDGGIWPVHCVGGTWGAELHPALDVVGPSVKKGTGGEDGYSGFTVRDPVTGETSPTGLAAMLEEMGVAKLRVGGIATDYCVKDTVLDGREAGFEVTVLTAAIRAVNLEPGDGERALEAMGAAGADLE